MKPKFSYPSQADIPADNPFKDRYVERDGKWILDIEGAVATERLAEFRDKNIVLTKENADLKSTWEGFDKAEVEALIAKKAEIEGAKIKSEGEFNQKLQERTAALKAESDKKIAELEKAKADNEAKLAEIIIDKALLEEGTKLGLRPEAADFLTTIGRKTFRMENGQPVAYGPDGKQLFDTEANPMKISNFVAEIAKKNAFAFKESTGGGAPGGAGSGGSGGSGDLGNPFKAGAGFNRTKQGEMFKADPALARRLAAEAGVTIG